VFWVINEPKDPSLNYKPKYTSYNQIKAENHRIAREKIGLFSKENDIKIVDKDPSLKYIDNPEHKTKKDIDKLRSKENFEQFNILMNRRHLNDVERLNLREDEIIADGYFTDDRKTKTKLKAKNKKETIEYNMNTFSKQTIGVHGHELPKFSENQEYKEYWKLKDDYVENPNLNSHLLYKEKIKYWKRPEELLLKDHIDTGYQEVLKKEHVAKEKKDGLIIKVNNLNHFKEFDPKNPKQIDLDNPPRNHIYRWTTRVNQFAPSKFKGRYFDSLPKEIERPSDKNQYLFSSFGNKGVFSPPYLANLGKKVDDKLLKNSDNEIIQDNLLNTNKESLYYKLSTKEIKTDKPDKGGIQNEKNNHKIITKGFIYFTMESITTVSFIT